jgi:hypothetical protein
MVVVGMLTAGIVAAVTTIGTNIATSGNLGIGTSTPLTALDIQTPYYGSTIFSGSGNNKDLMTGGIFTGASTVNYQVEIDNAGNPNTFKWSDDNGLTWDGSGTVITGGWQTLNNGVEIKFVYTQYHHLNDNWAWTAYPSGNTLFVKNGSVGIGTTDSSQKLAVTGNAYVTGSLVLGRVPDSNTVFFDNGLYQGGEITSSYWLGRNLQVGLNPTDTSTHASYYGEATNLYYGDTSSAEGSYLYGYDAQLYDNGTSNTAGMYVTHFEGRHTGSGKITDMVGGSFYLGEYSGGVTNMYGIRVYPSTNMSWAGVDNFYGIHIHDPSGDHVNNASYGLYIENINSAAISNYAIYSAGGQSYFAGSVGIGTVSPSALLSVGSSSQLQVNSSGNISTSGSLVIGSGTAIVKHLSVTATWDPGNLADGAVEGKAVTVTGAAAGDTCVAALSTIGAVNWLISCNISGDNTAQVVIMNKTGGDSNLASGTVRVDVWQH